MSSMFLENSLADVNRFLRDDTLLLQGQSGA